MKKLFISVSLLFASLAFSQVMQHNVQPKETIYGISKQYGITQDALINANPFLKNRELQIGDVLDIPSKNGVKPTTETVETPKVEDYEDTNFYYRVVKPKETVYRLAKAYKVTQESINSLNPFIKERGLQVGDVVRIAKTIPNLYKYTFTFISFINIEKSEPLKYPAKFSEAKIPTNLILK